MPSEHIDANIKEGISALTGVGISQDLSVRRAGASSVENTNKPLDCLSNFTNIK